MGGEPRGAGRDVGRDVRGAEDLHAGHREHRPGPQGFFVGKFPEAQVALFFFVFFFWGGLWEMFAEAKTAPEEKG